MSTTDRASDTPLVYPTRIVASPRARRGRRDNARNGSAPKARRTIGPGRAVDTTHVRFAGRDRCPAASSAASKTVAARRRQHPWRSWPSLRGHAVRWSVLPGRTRSTTWTEASSATSILVKGGPYGAQSAVVANRHAPSSGEPAAETGNARSTGAPPLAAPSQAAASALMVLAIGSFRHTAVDRRTKGGCWIRRWRARGGF